MDGALYYDLPLRLVIETTARRPVSLGKSKWIVVEQVKDEIIITSWKRSSRNIQVEVMQL